MGETGDIDVDRRTALKILGSGALVLSLAACGYYDNQSTKIEIEDQDYYLLQEKNYYKKPQNFEGKVFDISTNTFVTDANQAILLPQEDFFPNERSLFHWRETKATPEMLQNNPVFQHIIQRAQRLIDESSRTLGGQYKDFVIPQAVATAVRKTLQYDSSKAKWGSLSPFDFRLRNGLTDCQEFTATVAYAAAHFGIPSAVAMHTYLDPNGTGRRFDHLYNVFDLNNSCWIVDSTNSEKPYAFWDFLNFQEQIHNKPEAGIIKYDSLFPGKDLPFTNAKWTTAQSQQDKMAPNSVALAMDKIEV